MNKTMRIELAACAVIFAMILGCDSGKNLGTLDLPSDILEMASHKGETFANGAPHKTIDEMVDGDVIVAVNGYPLTKRRYDDVSVVFVKGLEQNGVDNQLVLGRKLDDFKQSYINKFVGQRILVDKAFSLGLVTTNEVNEHVTQKITELAKAKKTDFEGVLRPYKPFEKYFIYDIALAFVLSKVIDEKIPALAEVDDNFVKVVQDEVSKMNDAAQVTNNMIKARLADWKKQILDKKIDFTSVVRAYSMDYSWKDKDEEECSWGEFEESDMDEPAIAAAVFALRKGELSDVLEDEDGYHLVKVLDIIPPETDEEGRIVQKERRRLSHVYIEKNPLISRQTDSMMMGDLKWQMQAQAINKYIAEQITNGSARVEYPNGKNLFK